MPIYEFHCDKCDGDSEVLVRSTHWEGTKCPRCGSTRLSKKLSVFASASGSGDTGECCARTGGPCEGNGGGCGCAGGGHHH